MGCCMCMLMVSASNHAAVYAVEFFDLCSEVTGLFVDTLNSTHLLADAFEVQVVGFIDSRERTVQVCHFFAVVCQTCALFVDLLEGIGQYA